MITKNDIIGMARHITRRGNNIPDMKLMHPTREWFVGLGIVLITVIAGATYNAFSFRYYSSLESRVVGGSAEVVAYRGDAVQRVLATYQTRSATFDALRAGIVPTVPRRDDSREEEVEIQPDGAVRAE